MSFFGGSQPIQRTSGLESKKPSHLSSSCIGQARVSFILMLNLFLRPIFTAGSPARFGHVAPLKLFYVPSAPTYICSCLFQPKSLCIFAACSSLPRPSIGPAHESTITLPNSCAPTDLPTTQRMRLAVQLCLLGAMQPTVQFSAVLSSRSRLFDLDDGFRYIAHWIAVMSCPTELR